jgi:hypothetical protein
MGEVGRKRREWHDHPRRSALFMGQYSSGKRIVVALRSASVMIQSF